MQIDPYFQIPQRPVATTRGPVQLPMFFKEGDYVLALFLARRDRVQHLLADSSFTPAMVLGRYAVVSLVMANFNVCSDRPHAIASLAVPVCRKHGFQPVSPWRELFNRADQRHMGFYLLHCLTDDDHSMVVSREIWGHQKSMADIDLQLNGGRLNCQVREYGAGQPLLAFGGVGPRLGRLRPLSFTMFSWRKHQLLRSILDSRFPLDCRFALGFRLYLGDQDHPAINDFRTLGLNGKRPLVLLSSDCYQGRYDEGTVIEELQEAKPSSHRLRPLAGSSLRV